MNAWPPALCIAPTMKSVWPPKPEWIRALIREAFAWPKRSTCSAVLTLTMRRVAGDQRRAVGGLGAQHLRSARCRRPTSRAPGEPNRNDAVIGTVPVERAGLLQGEHAVAEHLGPHPQAACGRSGPRRVASGTAPMPGLQRRAVADPGGDAGRRSAPRRRRSPSAARSAAAPSASTSEVDRRRGRARRRRRSRACASLTCATTRPPRRRGRPRARRAAR